MRVRIPIDSKATRAYLSRVGKKQLPFATARALTWTARDVSKQLGAELDQYLDRPTPFTRRAFIGTRASKRKLQAYVKVKDIQAGYLKYAIKGGTRHPRGKAIGVPTKNQRRNKYGNMPRGKIQKLLAYPRNFSGTIRGVPGIWRRTGGKKNPGVKLLVAWEPSASYRRRYPFRRRVHHHARRLYAANFRKSFNQAMRSPR